MRRLLSCLLTLTLCLSLSVSCFAIPSGETGEPELELGNSYEKVESDKTTSLKQLTSKFLKKHSLNSDNFAFAYYNLSTGEEFVYNGDTRFSSADLERLPLALYYYSQVKAGALAWSDALGDSTIGALVSKSLAGSGYGDAYKTLSSKVGDYATVKGELVKLVGGEYSEVFRTTPVLSAGYLETVVRKMYADASKYGNDYVSNIITPLRNTNPGKYLGKYVGDYYITGVAGSKGDTSAAAGVVGTDQSYVLVAFCTTKDSEEVLSKLNETLCKYNTGFAEDTQSTVQYTTSLADVPESEKTEFLEAGVKKPALYTLLVVGVLAVACGTVWVALRKKRTNSDVKK